jgi:hypothetical protein
MRLPRLPFAWAKPILIGLVLAVLTLIPLVSGAWGDTDSSQAMVRPEGYELTGSFLATPPAPAPGLTSSPAQGGHGCWRSDCSDTLATGQLVSPTFAAPRRLKLQVSGFPSQPDISLLLKRTDTGDVRSLNILGTPAYNADPGEQGQWFVWQLPREWVGAPVNLIALDQSPYLWIGISEPQPASWLTFLSYGTNPIWFLFRYSLHFCLLALPGLIIISRWLQSWKLEDYVTPLAALTITALCGYGAFWFFWLNHILGIIVCSLFLLATAIYAGLGLRDRTLYRLLKQPDVAFPLALSYLVGLAYLAVLYLYSHPLALNEVVINSRFLPGFHQDTFIPHLFAERLYAGDDLRHPPLLGEWLSSDRPPLQTGLVLLQRPLVGLIFPITPNLSYQLIGTIAQCIWLSAVWALGRQLRLKPSQLAVVLSFCIFSGFFLFNSLYVWPKLLAATLAMGMVIAVFAGLRSAPQKPFAASVAGLGAGLGMVAHSGVVFTLLPTLGLMVIYYRRLTLRRIGLALILLILVILPWIGYQKLYEPPGNRLLKMHLAGVHEVDERSFSEALIEQYQTLGLTNAMDYKLANVKRLFEGTYHLIEVNPTLNRRQREFLFTFYVLGVLNLGWLFMAINSIRSLRPKLSLQEKVDKQLFLPPLLGLTSLGIWCLLLFGPGQTVIHHGSYATMILLFVGLGAWVMTGPKVLTWILLGTQIALFIHTWILSKPPVDPDALLFPGPAEVMAEPLWPGPNLAMVGLAVIATVGTVFMLFKLSRFRF